MLTAAPVCDASAVFITGVLSTATAEINYDNNGTLSPITDGLVSSGQQYDIKHGVASVLKLVVTGADGSTNFDINYHGAD